MRNDIKELAGALIVKANICTSKEGYERVYNDITPYTKNISIEDCCLLTLINTYETTDKVKIFDDYLIIKDDINLIKEVISDTDYFETTTEIEEVISDDIKLSIFFDSRNEEGGYFLSSHEGVMYRIYHVY